MYTENSNGSNWRKWDLHVHAPSSCFNNQFEGATEEEKWDKYIAALEGITDIAVIGLTDYFSIDGYKKVMEYKQNGRLTNIKLFIPNIELRIIPVSGRDIAINLHIIINPSIVDDIDSLIFQALIFKYNNRDYRCTRHDLIALGRDFFNNQDQDEVTAYKEGANQFKVDYNQLCTIINSNTILHKNLLIAVSNSNRDGNSGLQQSNLLAVRREIYRMSNIILSGNPNDTQYFLGKGTDTADQVISNYGSLKPCIMCSDAHELKDVGVFPNNRVTWIKADTSFEGLMQIVYEPEERVYIGEQCPDQKPDYQVIDSVVINHPEFHRASIPLNPNLNVIIGGKSSGKSILLGCIAKKIGTDNPVKRDNEKYNNFINELTNHTNLTWRDNFNSTNRYIEYYPQTHINNLATSSEEIQSILQDLVKSDETKAKKLEEYNQYCIKNKGDLNEEITRYLDLQSKLTDKNKELLSIGNKEGVAKEIAKLKLELDEIKKSMTPPVSSEDDDSFKKMIADRKNAKNQIKLLSADIESLSSVIQINILNTISEDITPLSQETQLKLKEIYDDLVVQVQLNWNVKITALIETVKSQINRLSEIISNIENKEIFKKCIAFYRSNESYKSKNETVEIQQEIMNSIEQVEKEIKHYEQNILECKSKILELHKNYYTKLEECMSLVKYDQGVVKIISKIVFNNQQFVSLVGERIDKRVSQAKDFACFSYTTPEDFHTVIKGVFNSLIDNDIKLQSGFQRDQMLLEVFSSNFFELLYDVDYQGDVLSEMSEGKKAYIILRLLLEFSDKQCPILIDQPEDDLDNRSIYTELAQYLRNIKKRRQIIVVTHNPNVVIGADAEEVIVANQHGLGTENQDNTKFQYISGSLETTFQVNDSPFILLKQGIKEHVCEILEGGEEAFKKRERKLGYVK